MSDPRNVAHAKKVTQETEHKAAHVDGGGTPDAQPGKKSAAAVPRSDPASALAGAVPERNLFDSAMQAPAVVPAKLEGSLVVLSQLKDLDFHSRAHLERLAALQMTVEDELKQPQFSSAVADVYASQNAFQVSLSNEMTCGVTRVSLDGSVTSTVSRTDTPTPAPRGGGRGLEKSCL